MKKGILMSGILGSLTIFLGIIFFFGEKGYALGTCSVTFNSGISVGASPCSLDKKMINGGGDSSLNIDIIPTFGSGFTGSRSFYYISTGAYLWNQNGWYNDAIIMNGTGYYYSGTGIATPVSGKILNGKLTPGIYSGSIWITVNYSGTYRYLEIPLQVQVFPSGCAKELGGTVYYLDPCSVSKTMEDGRGDEGYKFSLVSLNKTKSYGFNQYGYGSGYPLYANLCNPASGGGLSQTNFSCYFKDSVLTVGNYSGSLRVDISDSTGSGSLYLQLQTNVINSTSDIGCSATITGVVTYRLNPCYGELIFIDGRGNASFNVNMTFSSGGYYEYTAGSYGSGFPQFSVGCGTGGFGSYGNSVNIGCSINDLYMGTGVYMGKILVNAGENYGSNRYLVRDLKIISVASGTVIETPTNLQSVSGEVVYGSGYTGTIQQVKLSWDDNSLLEDYYDIYYSPNDKAGTGSSWTYYGYAPKNATGATSYITIGQYRKHFFKVRARSNNPYIIKSDFSNIERFIDVTVPQ